MDYMERLKCISDDVWEELHDANHYLRLAQKVKDMDTTSSSHYYDLAKQEMTHAEILTQMGARTASASGDDMMRKIWDWQADSINKKKMEIMAKISMFKD